MILIIITILLGLLNDLIQGLSTMNESIHKKHVWKDGFSWCFFFLDLLVPCNTRFVRLYIEVEYFWVLIAKVLESNRIPSLKSIVLAMPW